MSKKKNEDFFRKLVSLLLIAGGGAGVIAAVLSWIGMLDHVSLANRPVVVLMGLFVLVYGFSAWTGVELWRKKPGALKRAQILLLAQVPSLSVTGFAYQFYTGLALYLSLSQRPDIVIGFEFLPGSSLQFQLGAETDGFMLGVNLVAIVALYLLEKSRASLEAEMAASAGRG